MKKDDTVTHYVAPLIGVPGPVETYDTSPLEGLTDEERTAFHNHGGGPAIAFALAAERRAHAETKRLLAELTAKHAGPKCRNCGDRGFVDTDLEGPLGFVRDACGECALGVAFRARELQK